MAYDGLSERTQRIDEWPETGGEEPADQSRDRLGVHGIWEGLLAVIVVLAAAAVYQIKPDAMVGAGLQSFLLLAASLGFIAVGTGWSLRAAVPNLAVGPIAMAAAIFFAQQAQGGLGFGFGVTLAAGATVGVLLGVLVVGFGVPAWAGSLAVALLLGGWLSVVGLTKVPETITYDPADHALYWFVGFAAVSLLGGLFGLLSAVRRGVGSYRATGDPAVRPGFGAGMAALAAVIGSCLLAAGGGVLLALIGRGSTADLGIGWTGLAFGAVLLGGTSAYGRRGGVVGTLLGVVLLTLGIRFATEEGWRIPTVGYAGAAIVIGLLITRLIEAAGRPRSVVDREVPEWQPGAPATWSGELPYGTGGRALLALPAGSSVEAGEPPARLGGPTGPAGAAVADGSPGTLHGGIGDRATRLPQARAGDTPGGSSGAVLSGDIVPPNRSANARFGRAGEPTDPATRTRIWDVDPRGGTGPGPSATPSPY